MKTASVALLAMFLTAACSTPTDEEPAGRSRFQKGDEQDITAVEDTAVKEQAIANCWLYASAAWAESLHLNATGKQVDVSEGYWSFWYWYEEIVGGDLSLREFSGEGTSGDPIIEGGWWGLSAEIAARYGWMSEGDFRAGAEGITKAQWHKEAVDEVNASLASGLLSDETVRSDRVKVFDELARIWKLDEATIADLHASFGIGAVKQLDRGGRATGRVQSLETLKSFAADGKRVVTLEDIVGRMEPGSMPSEGRRVGADAWSEVRYQYDPATQGELRRAMLANVQDTLHKRTSVPVCWGVGSAAEGRYAGEQSYLGGLHESVLVDYEAEDVPGHGKLALGVPVTDESVLEAALAPEARITQFRLKNSWGQDPFYSDEEWRQFGGYGERPTTAKDSYLPAKPGYNDVEMAYFDSPAYGVDSWYGANSRFMLAVALPNEQRFAVPKKALKRAFVSFEQYRANDFAALGGADAICSGLAKKAGLGNTYGALLSPDGADPATGFDVANSNYRALSFRRGTLRAKPITFGAYPGVTQDGVGTDAAYWYAGGAATTCATTGLARDAAGAETEVPCDQRRALVCFEKLSRASAEQRAREGGDHAVAAPAEERFARAPAALDFRPSSAKAERELGVRFRPIEQTIRDVVAWYGAHADLMKA